MNTTARRQMRLHHAVSMIGGFLAGYALINHCDIFGNAQTANLISLVRNIFVGDFTAIGLIALGFLAYALGVSLSTLVQKKTQFNLQFLSLLLTSTAIIVIGFFPYISIDRIAILPILFVTPIQWIAFNEANGYVSSSIFSTNNVRQAVASLTLYFSEKNKKHLDRSKFYWLTLANFHTGVAISCVTSMYFGINSIWFGFIPVCLSLCAFVSLYGVEQNFFMLPKTNKN